MLLWKEKERQRDIQTDTQQNKRTSQRREVLKERSEEGDMQIQQCISGNGWIYR